jgi:hypothetical protein
VFIALCVHSLTDLVAKKPRSKTNS